MSTTDAIPKAVAVIGKFLKKSAQASPIKEIDEWKRADLQQIVNICSKKKEMKQCDTKPYLRVNTVIHRAHQDVHHGLTHS